MIKEEKKEDITESANHYRTSDDSSAPSYTEDPNAAGPEPTEEEWSQLREVSDVIPKSAFLVILVEFCERFTYYGLSGPFQNYIQNPNPPSCKCH